MSALIRPAVSLFLLLTLITGVIYPAVVTGIAKLAFHRQAEGSVVMIGDKAVGSSLIAQPFSDPKYFWPRASAANYDATASAGSNLSPGNPALADAVKGRVDALHAADPGNFTAIPVDLVTSSASGLDPHISIAAARYQIARVARARAMSPNDVEQLLDAATNAAPLGFLGDSSVNVLQLNLLLDHPQKLASSEAALDATGWKAHGFLPEFK